MWPNAALATNFQLAGADRPGKNRENRVDAGGPND